MVFKSELRPIPECTGFALNAVHGFVDEKKIEKSIGYLNGQVTAIRTPLSLSWALMGLGAWSQCPSESGKWVVETLQKQDLYGDYPISLLSQLVLSYYSEKGFNSLFKKHDNIG